MAPHHNRFICAKPDRRQCAFTLIELLVVIAILAAMRLSVSGCAKQMGLKASCVGNFMQPIADFRTGKWRSRRSCAPMAVILQTIWPESRLAVPNILAQIFSYLKINVVVVCQ